MPWGGFDRLIAQHDGEARSRGFSSRMHLIALLFAQLSGASSLREIETALQSHQRQLYHLGMGEVAKSTLAEANTHRPAAIFTGLFSALVKTLQSGQRRGLRDAVRLIDSTGLHLSSLSGKWATYSEGVCGAKAHIVYDPDADQPIYAALTPANVNDNTAAKQMPIEPGATYVFDLGYYDFAWWAKLHDAGCRIVSRFKTNTELARPEEHAVPAGSNILSDRTGYLNKRIYGGAKNPLRTKVREVRVRIETGKVLRIFTNDLEISAQQVADFYKRRWAIELFFRWVKQNLKIRHFLGSSENAVRIQIAVALIAFLLLRAAQQVTMTCQSPLEFARLIRANLMQRRAISSFLERYKPTENRQIAFTFPPRRLPNITQSQYHA
jgi:hypothetical protein